MFKTITELFCIPELELTFSSGTESLNVGPMAHNQQKRHSRGKNYHRPLILQCPGGKTQNQDKITQSKGCCTDNRTKGDVPADLYQNYPHGQRNESGIGIIRINRQNHSKTRRDSLAAFEIKPTWPVMPGNGRKCHHQP